MPPFGPISRRELIRALKQAGFSEPQVGKRHQFMVKGGRTLIIPNEHGADIGRELLRRILSQAGISREEWEKL